MQEVYFVSDLRFHLAFLDSESHSHILTEILDFGSISHILTEMLDSDSHSGIPR